MKLVKRFYLKDIRNYEQENNTNILNYFDDVFDIHNLIELIKMGNSIDTIEAVKLLSKYLIKTENGLFGAYAEIRDTLLGKQVEQGNESNLQTIQFNSMTDLLNELCKQAISIGLTYSEFWGMDTKEMYQVVDSINERKIEKENEDLAKMHTLACMIGAGVWGKLEKKPPQIREKQKSKENKESKIYVKGMGYFTQEEYKVIKLLQQQK